MSVDKKTLKVDFDMKNTVDAALIEKLTTYHRTKTLVIKQALTLLFTEYPDYEPPKPHKISSKNQNALEAAAKALHFSGGANRMAQSEEEGPTENMEDADFEEEDFPRMELTAEQKAKMFNF